jgi:hypothetical protein
LSEKSPHSSVARGISIEPNPEFCENRLEFSSILAFFTTGLGKATLQVGKGWKSLSPPGIWI